MLGVTALDENVYFAKLAEQAEHFAGLGHAPSPPDSSAVDAKLRAQDAELQRLQQALSDLETQARRADTVTTALQTELQTITPTITDRFDATTTTLTDCLDATTTTITGRLDDRTEVVLDTATAF